MAENSSQPRSIRFGVFEVDATTGEFRKAGIRLKLGGQPFQMLQALLERPGELVTREELRKRIWPANTFVDHDLALKKAVNRLRDVLGDSAGSPHFIETVPRRGYRFIGAIISRADQPGSTNKLDISNEFAVRSISRRGRHWRLAAGLVVAGSLLVLGFSIDRIRGLVLARSRAAPIRSIAVLPLVNLSADPEQEYFSDGMTDELIAELAKFGSLRVISHTSVERYKQTRRSLPDIARELNVDAVVEGRVMRSGDRVRITAQLIDARSDQHLWAQSYERSLKDVLSLQAEVARRIAGQVGISLTVSEQARLTSARSVDTAAHEAYLKGNFYWNRVTCKGYEKALEYYQQAVVKDPDFAAAYAGLAKSNFNLADWQCRAQKETFAKAQAAALKAIELEPNLSDPHTILGELAFYRDWNWPEAEREYIQALQLDRSDAGAHCSYSIYLLATGRQQEALSEMKTALDVDPTSELTNMINIYVFYLAHQFDHAIEYAHKTLELYPRSASTYYWLGQIYEQKHMAAEAGAAYLKDFSGGSESEDLKAQRLAFQEGGLLAYWQLLLKQRQDPKQPCSQTLVFAHLGNKNRALEALETGYRHHCDGLQFLSVEPVFDDLRAEARFQLLVREMNLPIVALN
jgi:TolB-like protein/DNA-binding winged helix-turn-helix (wHTH) protein/Flp pilus assembly protein TadD